MNTFTSGNHYFRNPPLQTFTTPPGTRRKNSVSAFSAARPPCRCDQHGCSVPEAVQHSLCSRQLTTSHLPPTLTISHDKATAVPQPGRQCPANSVELTIMVGSHCSCRVWLALFV